MGGSMRRVRNSMASVFLAFILPRARAYPAMEPNRLASTVLPATTMRLLRKCRRTSAVNTRLQLASVGRNRKEGLLDRTSAGSLKETSSSQNTGKKKKQLTTRTAR